MRDIVLLREITLRQGEDTGAQINFFSRKNFYSKITELMGVHRQWSCIRIAVRPRKYHAWRNTQVFSSACTSRGRTPFGCVSIVGRGVFPNKSQHPNDLPRSE